MLHSGLACDDTHVYTMPLLFHGQSASLIANAYEQSGWNHPLPVFWNILLSMHIYGILFEHMAKSYQLSKKLLACL